MRSRQGRPSKTRMRGVFLALAGSFGEADVRVRNAWLLFATLLVALQCSGELMRLIMVEGLSMVGALPCLLFIAVTVLMAFRPAAGCLLTVACYVPLTLCGVSLPSGSLVSVLLAIGVGGYAFSRIGLLQLTAVVSAWFVKASWPVSQGAGGTWATTNTHPVSFGGVTIGGPFPLAALALGCLLAGVAVRWSHERGIAQAELDQRRQREHAARDIHDYVSNDLAYLVLWLNDAIADRRPPSVDELRELREVASGALAATHRVIGVMEGDAPVRSSNGTSRRKTLQSVPDANSFVRRIRDLASDGDRRLAQMGFDGRTIVSVKDGDVAFDDPYDDGGLVDGLLEELYGNILKHADPAGGYVMTVGIGSDVVRIVCTDTPLAHDDGQHGRLRHGASSQALGGTGLNRYRELLHEHGGTLTVDVQGGEWTVSAVIGKRGA